MIHAERPPRASPTRGGPHSAVDSLDAASAMFLILAHAGDATAAAVAEALRARYGVDRTALLTDEDLIRRVGWTHVVESGGAHTTLRLPGGRRLGSHQIAAVFNRLHYLDPAHFAAFSDSDRAYAVSEMFALLVSWLAGLPCPVVNAPDPRGLGGTHRSLFEWLTLAADAGLPTRMVHFATNARAVPARGLVAYQPRAGARLAGLEGFAAVPTALLGQRPAVFAEAADSATANLLVVGDRVLGELQAFADAARLLARRVRASLLQCVFVRPAQGSDRDWRCTWIDPLPALDGDGVAAVAAWLGAARRSGAAS